MRAAVAMTTPPNPAQRPGEQEKLVTVYPAKGKPYSYVAVRAPG